MVTGATAPSDPAPDDCRRLIEPLLTNPGPLPAALASFPAETVEATLKTLLPRGAALLPILDALQGAPEKTLRKVARRIRYRLRAAGVALPEASSAPPPPEPTWTLQEAWATPVDGTGSRAVWLTGEGPYGAWLRLSLVLNDQEGILDATGGAMAKKRLTAELERLRGQERVRWIPLPPAYARALIAEAAVLHGERPLPGEFLQWQAVLAGPPAPRLLILEHLDPAEIREDPTLLDHSGDLLTQPELGGWFFDPGAVQSAALEREEAKASRLVLSDAQKAEREADILARCADERFTGAERARWRRRLEETAYVFWQTQRPREARLALAAAQAVGDDERAPRHQPFCLAVVRRSLEVAAEVQAGRLSAEAVSRVPRRPGKE